LKRTLRSILHQFDSLDLAIENAFQVN